VKGRRSKSWAMAYCGMAAALSVAMMLMGAVFPIAMFIAPAVASFLIATVCVECGKTMALTAYGAVSLLSLLFVPDKEVALVFVFLLGYYPLVKPKLERIRPKLLRGACKLLLCNGAVLAMYGLVLLLVPAGSISQELRTTALAVSLATLAMGNVAFLLYDRAIHNLLQLYRLVWQPKLHKMLGK
jgi:MFS family permease